jgi:hypothetical protein
LVIFGAACMDTLDGAYESVMFPGHYAMLSNGKLSVNEIAFLAYKCVNEDPLSLQYNWINVKFN